MSSEVKRYDPFGYDGLSAMMKEDAHGDWVRGEDYDALHAEAEALHRQVTELTSQRDAILLQARCWAGEAKAQQAITKAVGEALGGVPDWGPIAAGVDALQQRLTTEQGNAAYWKEQYQALRNDYQRTVSKKVGLRTELEAARGLLEKSRLHLKASGHNLAADDIGRHLAENVTPAPEVRQEPEALPDSEFVNEFMDWWEKHGQYVRSGGGDYERTFAFEAWRYLMPKVRAAEQGERQEAVATVGAVIDRKRKVFSIDILDAADLHPGTKLYTTPQPSPDVRGLAAFALELIDGAWEGGSFDGGDIQEAGVRHGILVVEQREEACGKHCDCAEHGFPAECYRLTPAFAVHRQAQQGGSHEV